MTRVQRLGDASTGRDNGVQAIRYAAATAVIVFHCYALTDHWTEEPLYRLAHQSNLGLLGVQVFFVLSGFLVTQSWFAHPQLRAFASARVLRIYPALIAATLFTIAVAGASSTLAWPDYLADPQTRRYLWRTASGYDVTDGLPGVFLGNPFPRAANGSLWTLPVELRLYAGIALAGVAGLLARRKLMAVLVLVAVVAASLLLRLLMANPVVGGLVMIFALASLAYAWRDSIPLSPVAALAAIGLFAWDPGGHFRTTLFAPLLVYTVLVAAYHPLLTLVAANRLGDYSYGLYVYAFPVQQTLVRNVDGVQPMALLALALPLTLACAVVSWHCLEKPALALKSRFRPQGPPR